MPFGILLQQRDDAVDVNPPVLSAIMTLKNTRGTVGVGPDAIADHPDGFVGDAGLVHCAGRRCLLAAIGLCSTSGERGLDRLGVQHFWVNSSAWLARCWLAAFDLGKAGIVDGAGDVIGLQDIAGVVVAGDRLADALAELLTKLGADRFLEEEPILIVRLMNSCAFRARLARHRMRTEHSKQF